MRVLLTWLSLIIGAALLVISIGPFQAALQEDGDTPDGLMVGFGLVLLLLGLALLWRGWRTLRRR